MENEFRMATASTRHGISIVTSWIGEVIMAAVLIDPIVNVRIEMLRDPENGHTTVHTLVLRGDTFEPTLPEAIRYATDVELTMETLEANAEELAREYDNPVLKLEGAIHGVKAMFEG